MFAKVTDTVGRWEAFCASATLYTLGYVIVAASPTVGAYAVGQCLYQVRMRPSRSPADSQIGITGFWLIVRRSCALPADRPRSRSSSPVRRRLRPDRADNTDNTSTRTRVFWAISPSVLASANVRRPGPCRR